MSHADPRTAGVVLVTGGEGFIGAQLCELLTSQGRRVRVLDRNSIEGKPERVRHDVRAPLPERALADVDVVVHLAALTGVRPSLKDPEGYRQVNVEGTRNVLAAAAAAGVARTVVASSSSVYGNCSEPATEARGLDPLSPYAHSKAEAEEVAHAHARAGLSVAVVRPFTVYGPGQRADMLLSRALRGEQLELWEFERDMTQIETVLRGLVALMDAPLEQFPDSAPLIVNVAGGELITAQNVLDELDRLGVAHKATLREGESPPGEPVRTWADTSVLAALGVTQDSSFAQGLARQWAHISSERIPSLGERCSP